MTTIGETRRLRPGQYLLDPYITRAREIEAIREHGKLDWKADASTDARSHLWGALGELLVADVLGTRVDDTAKYSDGGVDGTFKGYTYDVKTTGFLHNPFLRVFTKNQHWSDIYILVGVQRDALLAELIGWATAEEVRSAPTRDFGHGLNFVLGKRQLHPFSELGQLNEK